MAKNNFYRELEKFVDELYANGTAAKWENERLEKEAKKTIRKASRKAREALGELCAKRPVRAA